MIVVHRDVAGEHNTDSDTCWCDPILIDEDKQMTNEDWERIRLSDLKN